MIRAETTDGDNRLATVPSVGLLLVLLAVCFGVAAVGGLSTVEGVRSWYPALDKPPWTPPNWAFGPIWTFLYIAMAAAVWDAARRDWKGSGTTLALFFGQLALNALWSPVFFAWQRVWVALLVITLLWVNIVACIRVFSRSSHIAAALFIPYLCWVSVAWSLNAWICWFNP